MERFGRWVMLVGSLILGLLAGWIGLWIFEAKVPSGMRTSVLDAEAKVYYLGSGLALGLLIFAWTRVATAIARRAAIRSVASPSVEP